MEKEVLGYVRVERDESQGYRGLKTIKSFWPCEVVLREKPLMTAPSSAFADRLVAYSNLDIKKKGLLLQCTFTQFEVDDRGIDVTDEALAQALEVAKQRGAEVPPADARCVLQRCMAGSLVDELHLYEQASLLRHSCAADVEFVYSGGMGAITARHNIAPQKFIGQWLLEDFNLWWKGANVRSAALQKAGLLNQECMCERCQGEDTCRAIKCPGCFDFQKRLKAARLLMLMSSSAVLMASFVGWCRVTIGGFTARMQGEVTRNGKLKRWRCNVCDFNASDVAVEGYIKIENKLVQELSDARAIPDDKLLEQVDVVTSRVGNQHWLAASLNFEVYDRCMREGGTGMTYSACLASLRVAEWILSRKLPAPPQRLTDHVAEMMFHTLHFVGERLSGIRDLRVCYLRAVDLLREFFETIDKRSLDRFKTFAGAAQNIRRRCGFCQKFLKENIMMKEGDISADDFHNETTICSRCATLSYCGLSCQMSDWKRHRHYCIPLDADFYSARVGRILVPA